MRLSDNASKSLLISYFKLSVSTMFFILLKANFTFSVFFFNYSITILFSYESFYWFYIFLLFLKANFVVKFIVYLAYFSSSFLNYNLFKVTWLLFSPFDMERYRLNVRIKREEMIIPDMAAVKLMILPR